MGKLVPLGILTKKPSTSISGGNSPIKDVLDIINETEDICILADREVIKELVIGLNVEECPFVITGCKPEDDLLMFAKIGNTYVVECPFNRKNNKLLYSEGSMLYIENDAMTFINERNELPQLQYEEIEIFDMK